IVTDSPIIYLYSFPTRRSSDLRDALEMFAGINNELLKAVLNAFYLRFTPKGRVLWVSEADDPVLAARDELHQLGVSLLRPRSLPDRKSTRLNSSHQIISYAVFC